MKFENVLLQMKEGKIIKRKGQERDIFFVQNRDHQWKVRIGRSKDLNWTHRISADDLLAEDWEVIEE
jgi:hypothetical protein